MTQKDSRHREKLKVFEIISRLTNLLQEKRRIESRWCIGRSFIRLSMFGLIKRLDKSIEQAEMHSVSVYIN